MGFGIITLCNGDGRIRVKEFLGVWCGRIGADGVGALVVGWIHAGDAALGVDVIVGDCETGNGAGDVLLDSALDVGESGGGNEPGDPDLDILRAGECGSGNEAGERVLDGGFRAGDGKGVSKSNAGFEVVVGGSAGAADVLSNDEKSHISPKDMLESSFEGRKEDAAMGASCVVGVISLEPAARLTLELWALVSKKSLPGRLLTVGEATISPHSSSSSSSLLSSGTAAASLLDMTGAGAGGDIGRTDSDFSGSGTPGDALSVERAGLTSSDCLVYSLGGRGEAGVKEPVVPELQLNVGAAGGKGILSGERGAKLLTPAEAVRECARAVDCTWSDKGR